ncbi:hypothetical protein GFS24_18175 [Chitinophaga sp. SYP-B3965]|uniref:hypothetical protein n=1 Tax=Chitinophaga sp. SYP-B3965 TaxID=2663120 RepID=UPI001299E984|nr:hypothetical protein [Chitinophaga sp. SYP-B3965]MRG47056.1 hypothetical protein [Chitinophaga sp. SYP-B3965]
MKTKLIGISAMICLLASCSEKDNAAVDPPDVMVEWFLSAKIRNTDTTRYFYDNEHKVSKVLSIMPYPAPSGVTTIYTVQVPEYVNGRIEKMRVTLDSTITPRLECIFQYNGSLLSRIDYYNDDSSPSSAADSLVYADGKLKEYVVIQQGKIDHILKLQWTGGNITKVERHRNNEGTMVHEATINYTYDDKANFWKNIPGNFEILTNPWYVEYLSENNLLKEETTLLPSNVLAVRNTMVYTYDAKGLLEKIATKEEDLPNSLTKEYTENLQYIKK